MSSLVKSKFWLHSNHLPTFLLNKLKKLHTVSLESRPFSQIWSYTWGTIQNLWEMQVLINKNRLVFSNNFLYYSQVAGYKFQTGTRKPSGGKVIQSRIVYTTPLWVGLKPDNNNNDSPHISITHEFYTVYAQPKSKTPATDDARGSIMHCLKQIAIN